MNGSTRPPGEDPRTVPHDRGLSDVIAFTLTFLIIVTSVALVGTVAFGSVVDMADHQHVRNADRGTQAAASILDDLHRDGATYRQFSLSPGDGALFFNRTNLTIESGDINLSAIGVGATANSTRVPVGALETRFDRSDRSITVAYEGGGVFRTDYATSRYSPSIRCSPDGTTIVSLVNLTTHETIRESGVYNSEVAIQPTNAPGGLPFSSANRYATFEAELVGHERALFRGSDIDLEINANGTAQPEQWGFFFERAAGWNADGSCDGSDAVLIRVTTIEVRYRYE